MAFSVPQFPLLCNIFSSNLIAEPRLVDVKCNLAWGRRVSHPSIGSALNGTDVSFPGTITLLLPKETDIRDRFNDGGQDAVECPAGSLRFYSVVYVDDIGKGFDNEHRAAVLEKRGNEVGLWPTPIP